ncbi:uncharacterized protein LOC102716990 [Oryza brachyantha]|uniref:SKP1 component POZ domain-containing protein n=1 Tax=Oryza brachyantha TaxID=4533 RepID=J3MN49_ORYBR|nr:uncharacterized protein LOC102716990 [Oryza brachyantha]
MAAGNGEAAGASAAEKKVECAMVSEAAEEVAAVDEVVLDAAEKLQPEVVEEVLKVEVGKREEEEESGRMITLKSSDGELLDVTEASARQSQIFTQLIDSGSADPHILLPIVDAETLKKVIEYCDKHATDSDNEELENWDETFINELYEDRERLFEVIKASNYLCIDGLLNLTCDKVADTLKTKTLEEIREAYSIHNDLTEEEKEEIRRENAWAFKRRSKGVKRMQSDHREESGRMITLKSSDGALIEVAEASARLSKTIGNKIDDGRTYPYILLPEVDAATLEKIIAYCNQHADKKSDTVEEKEYLKNWDKTFIDEVAGDTGFLVKVVTASTYLKIDGLHDLACLRVTEAVKEKSLEEILKAFNVSE